MLEVINANVGLVAALFISGAALGVIVARFTLPGPRRVRQLEEQLEKANKEHETYRAGVTTHFKKTAELVGEMTQSYKAVYDHLAYGAQSLCGEYEALTSSVFGPPRVIHDPTVAVGETVVAAGAAAEATTAKTDASSAEPQETTSQNDRDIGPNDPDEAVDARDCDADATEAAVPTFSMSEAVSEIREKERIGGGAGSDAVDEDAAGETEAPVKATGASDVSGSERESAGRA